ncbi:MAG: hypothetical protein ACYCZR_00050 [Burkholderiales bacterium]
MKMDINQYLSDVAVAVGGTFHAQDTYGKAVIGYITLSTGERFWINAGGYGMEDRVEISTRFPQHQSSERNDARATMQRDFDKDVPHNKKALAPITFAVTKTPAAAARDIERRFLREYRELYARAIVWCDAQAAYWSGKAALEQAANHHLRRVRFSPGARVYADLGYVNNETCTVQVHGLCAHDVAKLAEFLAGL